MLGAHEACLRWEEHAVLGTVRESANRLANCDEANAKRAAAAAERQAAAARSLMASPAWGALPRSVRDAAELRLRYPYLSLQELAGRAQPPMSKSALNHRLRRLSARPPSSPADDAARRGREPLWRRSAPPAPHIA